MMVGDAPGFAPPDYSKPVDFVALAAQNKDLKACLSNNHGRLDFKDGEHLRSDFFTNASFGGCADQLLDH
jgi:hypothetical protein